MPSPLLFISHFYSDHIDKMYLQWFSTMTANSKKIRSIAPSTTQSSFSDKKKFGFISSTVRGKNHWLFVFLSMTSTVHRFLRILCDIGHTQNESRNTKNFLLSVNWIFRYCALSLHSLQFPNFKVQAHRLHAIGICMINIIQTQSVANTSTSPEK